MLPALPINMAYDSPLSSQTFARRDFRNLYTSWDTDSSVSLSSAEFIAGFGGNPDIASQSFSLIDANKNGAVIYGEILLGSRATCIASSLDATRARYRTCSVKLCS